MGEGGEEAGLEFTPTWVVAVVCTIIITISLLVERCIHYAGQVSIFQWVSPILSTPSSHFEKSFYFLLMGL